MNFFHKDINTDDTNRSYLIIGLGNPGRKYRFNRHNVGFMTVDKLAATISINLSRVQNQAIVGSGRYHDKKIIIAKPQTFMNLSGQAVASLVHFYKVPLEQMLVIHDDLDLPFETLRLRPEGSSGGQKGLASIIGKLGTEGFPRLRMGIGRPTGRMDSADYVLQDFPAAEATILPHLIERACQAALTFIDDGVEAAMNQYNGVLSKE